jgi:Holliday junction resolvase RusA-like endonuclease
LYPIKSRRLIAKEKFFLDALVELGCIEDDNDNFIKETKYNGDKIDKQNPRVEVRITEGL